MKVSTATAIALALSLSYSALSFSATIPSHVIDMTKVIVDEHGKPVKDMAEAKPGDSVCKECPYLTLGTAIAHALFATYQDEQSITPEQKWARAVLANRVRDDKAATLTVEEVTVIKRVLGKAYNGLLLMQAFPILDPNSKPPQVQ